ncbi:poly [ADP-ribose] polymerase 1-like [Sitodiplosis mosellana]|uniref:poly [ADP-ribose] polymerase 1-like n=1 Tax=Sitodiplosis mosellana TaxID=263140 RepID=UPI002444D5C2|nr:poly [ADP-ribose] polymerase 1-like [Sitodiplosis mosellana]
MKRKLLYKAEYTKSKNSICKGCKIGIKKDVLRLVYLQKSRKFDGRERKCYHPCCFFKKYRPRSQFNIDGFAKLRHNDQEVLVKLIDCAKKSIKKRVKNSNVSAVSSEHSDNGDHEPPSKKIKPNSQDNKLDTVIRNQNEEFHDLREKIKENVDKDSRKSILRYNAQSVPRDNAQLLDHVTDVLFFGAIVPCKVKECKNGNFEFDGNTTYRCTGQLSGFGDCNNEIKEPERRPVKIPPEISEAYPFLHKEFKAESRAIKDNPKSSKAKQALTPKRASLTTTRKPKFREMVVKDGAIVDPGSRLQNIAHVYITDEKPYSVALDKVELSVHKDQNSYYKLQLLESDADPKKYWIYRAWGRINENIGDDKCDEYSTLDEAITCFCKLYRKKTWNNFGTKYFEKRAGMYYQPSSSKPNEKVYKIVESTTLDSSVQDLLKLLINEDMMSAVMVKFCLDMNKMPLGKVKRVQIVNAFKILHEIERKIMNNESHASLVEASNRFYSIIPHKACSKDALVTRDDLANKAEMLQDLQGIQLSYEFLYKTGESGKNILDDFYFKLNAIIEPLDINSEQFKIIKGSVDNTNLDYDFEVEEIFKVQRKGENKCNIFNGLTNRKLLWHGTKITNVNLILAHSLKIAPPEAIVIGCMFGKGLYFSDVVGNSAKYCYASQSNNTGIVLLCEVALGDSMKCFDPENIDELPYGKNSVHGVGKYSLQSSELIDGAIFACGEIKKDDTIQSCVDYNEFVVYNNQQVKIKYLVKLRFSDSVGRFK